MSGCLGSAVAALVDGELDHAGRERVHRHLTRCAPCRAEVEAQRRTKARVRAAGAPAPSDALCARLLALGAAGPGDARPQEGLWRVPLSAGGESRGTGLLERRAPGVRRSGAGRGRTGGSGGGRSVAAGAPGPLGRAVPPRALRRRATAGSAFVLLGVAAALALGAPPTRSTPAPGAPAEQAFVSQPVGAPRPDASPSGLRTSPVVSFVTVPRAALLTSTRTAPGGGSAR